MHCQRTPVGVEVLSLSLSLFPRVKDCCCQSVETKHDYFETKKVATETERQVRVSVLLHRPFQILPSGEQSKQETITRSVANNHDGQVDLRHRRGLVTMDRE